MSISHKGLTRKNLSLSLGFVIVANFQSLLNVQAQGSLPQLKDVAPSVSISFSPSTGLFQYDYVLTNSPNSTGEIREFEVDIKRLPDTVEPSDIGLTIPIGTQQVPFRDAIISGTTVQTVPIGAEVPVNWHVGIGRSGVVSFFGKRNVLITPGQSLSGFKVLSRGVPGIRQANLTPFFIYRTVGKEATDEDERRATMISQQINVTTQAIGPTALLSLDPSSLLDRLISLKHQSVSLGWLRGLEFIKDLDEKLDQAKEAIFKNHPNQARHKLQEFIHKLDAQRKEQLERQHEASEEGKEEREEHSEDDKKFINDNAFFLLKVNAEFIISKLPAKPADKDDEERDSEDGSNPEKR